MLQENSKINGFCYQQNTHFSQAIQCSRETFWGEVRNTSNQWKIDSRRAILEAVESNDLKAIEAWTNEVEYQKFLGRKRSMKNETARQKFFQKTDAERLMAFAQELKNNLTAFIFSCREFDEMETGKGTMFRHRRLADCHLNGLVMLDIDHVENPMAVFDELKKHEELMARTALVHITSSKKGIRIVFTANIKDGNLADNQIVFARRLGYQADQSCIDATRNSFVPKEDDILYINEALLFDYYDEKFDKMYTPAYREKNTQPQNQHFDDAEREEKKAEKPAEQALRQDTIMWLGYDVQQLIDKRYEENLPCKEKSNRHAESLKLASDLLVLLDGDKKLVLDILMRQSWVQEIVDERDEDVEQTVKSAAERLKTNEKKYSTQSPSKDMQTAILEVTGKSWEKLIKPITAGARTDGHTDIEEKLEAWGEHIEALMPHYPILRDICKDLKRNQYPAAVFTASAFMMTLMTRCTYRFYHRPEELRRLNCSTLIIGDPTAGKSYASRLYKLLMAPVQESDDIEKGKINKYREEMKMAGANDKKSAKPKAKVRIHPARTSNAQFIQDMVNCVEMIDGMPMQLHMLTFDTELDNTLAFQTGGTWIAKQALELKAFHNEEDGQAYSNVDSPIINFNVTWNSISTGTPLALKKKAGAQGIATGAATRYTCIPMPTDMFDTLEVVDTIDLEPDKRLKEWGYKLDKMKGELTIKKIVMELKGWTDRRIKDAELNNSPADALLARRCGYHAVNNASPFIVVRHWDKMHQEGEYWCGEFETDDIDWELAELLVDIQYGCQKHYFGAMAEKYFDDKERDAACNVQRKQKTIEQFSNLPETFTVNVAQNCFGLNSTDSACKRINRLMKDGLVVKDGTYVDNGTTKAIYKKTGKIMI